MGEKEDKEREINRLIIIGVLVLLLIVILIGALIRTGNIMYK
ncbi:hypothetical protein [Methanobacterium congolense]|uniref:Region of a membrane-bound protein predicted to be embedded in the membrane n=1 Tax=Methanobacterium congolense TaxID=118062 RepID=A0A1D3L0Y1_9EURY|nr:hypothetical protein [Methanobacterium congolense]SCG85324.1 Region of a membrane-bound protein predicted to be embedded in the membrane [Methanobacterium congolense]